MLVNTLVGKRLETSLVARIDAVHRCLGASLDAQRGTIKAERGIDDVQFDSLFELDDASTPYGQMLEAFTLLGDLINDVDEIGL